MVSGTKNTVKCTVCLEAQLQYILVNIYDKGNYSKKSEKTDTDQELLQSNLTTYPQNSKR